MKKTQELTPFQKFFKKFGFLLPVILGLIGVIFIFSSAPFLRVQFKDADKNKWEVVYNIYQLLQDSQPFNWAFYLALILIGIAIILACLKPLQKNLGMASFVTFVLAIIMLFMMGDLYAKNGIPDFKEATAKWGLVVAVVFFILAAEAEFVVSYNDDKMTVRDIAEDGVLIAMAFILNLLRLFPMPTGGSVNFQMLPLFIIALRHGPVHSFLSAGLVYGVLTCLTDGYGLQFLILDYVIGFGSVTILGLFRKFIMEGATGYNLKGELFILLGGTLASVVRFAAGTLSSMINYEYDIATSMLYNVGYVFVSGGMALAALMIIYGPFVKLSNALDKRQSISAAD